MTDEPEGPSRWTGPFLKSDFPEFSNIQLLLNGNKAQWYYNNYWNAVIRELYARYYDFSSIAGHTLPDPSPTPSARLGVGTGKIPQGQGAHGILLELAGIYYTSFFGGSLKLVFENVEDDYYEFRIDPYVYDLRHLELHVFFVPLAARLHPPGQIRDSGLIRYPPNVGPQVHGGVFHNFKKSVKGIYALKYPDTELFHTPPPKTNPYTLRPITYQRNKVEYETAIKHLNTFLLDWNLTHHSLKTDIAPVSFGYGFLHQLHQDSINTPMIRPRRISIRDNDFDLATEQGEFSFGLSAQVTDLDIDVDGEVKITLITWNHWKPAWGTGISQKSKWKIDYPERRRLHWHSIFRYTFQDAQELLDDCNYYSTETENYVEAHVTLFIKVGTTSLFTGFHANRTINFHIPMCHPHSAIDSVYDLALREVGGDICDHACDDEITLVLEGPDDEPKGKATFRIRGRLRIK